MDARLKPIFKELKQSVLKSDGDLPALNDKVTRLMHRADQIEHRKLNIWHECYDGDEILAYLKEQIATGRKLVKGTADREFKLLFQSIEDDLVYQYKHGQFQLKTLYTVTDAQIIPVSNRDFDLKLQHLYFNLQKVLSKDEVTRQIRRYIKDLIETVNIVLEDRTDQYADDIKDECTDLTTSASQCGCDTRGDLDDITEALQNDAEDNSYHNLALDKEQLENALHWKNYLTKRTA